MHISKDPDTLRIPAFMRKRSLARRTRKPLVLTALDRKQAGILPEGLKRPKIRKTILRKKKTSVASQNSIFEAPVFLKTIEKKARAPRIKKTRAIKQKAMPSFAAPVIGKITHYYEKIRVAVMQISDTLSVGDCITYETETGEYDQVVDSMEIERTPVFKAQRGDDIGIKLQKKPIVGSNVTVRNA